MTHHPAMARFWGHVDLDSRDNAYGCWEWRGGCDRDGYGHFWADGKTHRAARWIYDQLRGLRPDELVRHTCDNPPCVNPAHLIPGDAKANTGDMLDRGRRPAGLQPPPLPGTANHKAKLTDDQVRAIRTAYAAGARQVALAAEHGVTQPTISRITRGAGWTHVA